MRISNKSSPPAITEAQFQDQIIDLAHLYGWKIAHFRAARTKYGWATPVAGDGKGFPDAVLVKAGLPVIFAEFKRDGAKLSAEQQAWGELIEDALGARWFVWRPEDFDFVKEILSTGAKAEEL
jgi:hypothetical protein